MNLEKTYSCEIWEQEGGELHSVEIINSVTGLTKCIYTSYGISLEEGDDPQDVDIEIEGYVVEIDPLGSAFDGGNYVFVATKVFESYKLSI